MCFGFRTNISFGCTDQKAKRHDEEADLILHELCSLMAQRANKVKKLVSYLSTAVRNRDYEFVSTFITIYSRYTTTWQLLNWIMQTYGPFEDENEEDQLERNAIIYFIDQWTKRCKEDFCQNLDLDKLNHLMDYVKLHMLSSHLVIRVEELMSKVEEQKATPKEEEVADLEPSSESASELPTSEMPEALHATPACASDHQGELEPQEDAKPEFVEPTVLVAQPTPLLQAVSEEDVPTAADAQPPPDVAADAPAPGQALLPVLVEEIYCVSSLPNFNILLERFRMTCSMVDSTICRAEMHFLFRPNLPLYVLLTLFYSFWIYELFHRY